MKTHKTVTFSQFNTQTPTLYSQTSVEITEVFHAIILAAKNVNRAVRKAGLLDILGAHGSTNIQGEDVKKLDIIANDAFIAALSQCTVCCAILSEENEDIVRINNPKSNYIVAMDPLDGSSNIDVNAPIGTIFSIFKRSSLDTSEVNLKDCLQDGNHQLAAGYIIYGSSTMLVYTSGHGVHGFTYDDSLDEFCLSHPNITMPKDGTIYSINEGNQVEFPNEVNQYIQYCKEKDFASGRPYSARYIGSLIADFHRNLIKGGIFIYPATDKSPSGKLRLLYECNPMAFIAEQAGGKASTGTMRIMDVKPEHLHQRVPLFIGSENMVKKAEEHFTI